jgi:solute carrier family 45 protein 1/2/4
MGRRRPFIIAASFYVLFSLILIAFSREIADSFAIYSAVLGFYILDFSINAVQASCRSLIVDKAPSNQQKTSNAFAAFMIGMGNFIGYLCGSINLSEYLRTSTDQMKLLCTLAAAWFILCISITVLFSSENQHHVHFELKDLHWYSPLVEIWHAMTYLPAKIRNVCHVQFFSWIAWFPFLFYSSSWVSSLTNEMDSPRTGSLSLLFFACISLFTGFVIPYIYNYLHHSNRRIVYEVFSLKKIWIFSQLFFAFTMFLTAFAKTSFHAVLIIALAGFSWGITQWVPFTIIGEYIALKEEEAQNYTAFEDDDYIWDEEPKLQQSSYMSIPSIDIHIPHEHHHTHHTHQDRNSNDTSHNTNINTTQSTTPSQISPGLMLGIHNIYIVLPQFTSALFSFIVFFYANDVFGSVLRLSGVFSIVAAFVCAFKRL